MGVRSVNNSLQEFLDTFVRSGTDASVEPSGISATGGVISDYVSGSSVYRAHIFTSSGTFNVTAPGTFGNTIEYLVVAGGGGGGSSGPAGNAGGGGGGAGGLRTNIPGVQDVLASPLTAPFYTVSAFPTSYTVTIGAGGAGRTTHAQGGQGGNSEFYPTPVSYPSTAFIRSVGGGGGGFEAPNTIGAPGGSGGGGGRDQAGGSGNTPSDPNHPIPMGKNGYGPGGGGQSGGGGGAGEAGQAYSSPQGGRGGDGVQVIIAGPTSLTGVGASNPGTGQYQWFAGGGGGGGISPGPINQIRGGYGGGGNGGQASPTQPPGTWDIEVANGSYATGGGGGGGSAGPTTYSNLFKSGHGGSGIVIVRYQIAQLTATAKATGGAISYYGGKTIHAFTSSGTFNATSPLTAEVLLVGGGGSGGNDASGGGGAGGFVYYPAMPVVSGPLSVVVGAGGASAFKPAYVIAPGGSSTFNSGTALGGGGAGYNGAPSPSSYASGGGGNGNGGLCSGTPLTGASAAQPSQPNPGASINAGNAGGNGTCSPTQGGGGGGGAGATGDPRSTNSGKGGDGLQAPSTFRNPMASYGTPGPGGTYYFAGGGGGGNFGTPGGAGGAGGGGRGSNPSPTTFDPAQNALQNTGGGGGGGGGQNVGPTDNGGAGGSGIVLIAYPS